MDVIVCLLSSPTVLSWLLDTNPRFSVTLTSMILCRRRHKLETFTDKSILKDLWFFVFSAAHDENMVYMGHWGNELTSVTECPNGAGQGGSGHEVMF